METVHYWKRIWKTVNSTSSDINAQNITDILDLSKVYLVDGILKFKPYSQESYNACLEMVKVRPSSAFGQFLEQLSIMLNLETPTTWAILCNYLMFEFHGKIEDMNKIIQFPLCSKLFMKDVWNFYTLERLFIIKTNHLVLQEHANPNNKFNKCFDKFIETVTIKKIQEGLLNQYQYLMEELFNLPANVTEQNTWIERNLVEQKHILHTLLVSLQFSPFSVKELFDAMHMFKKMHFDKLTDTIRNLVWVKDRPYRHSRYLQISIIVSSIKCYWGNYEAVKPFFHELNPLIEEHFSDEENMCILLTWTTLQIESGEDLFNDKLITTVIELFHSHVFVQMYYLAACELFSGTKAGSLIKDTIYTVFATLCTKFSGERIYLQDGCVALLAELLKEHHIATDCLSGQSQGVKACFIKALSLFPHEFYGLSSIMRSLISLQKDTSTLIAELYNIQVYTKSRRNCYITIDEDECLIDEYRPLNFNMIRFPRGTKVDLVEGGLDDELVQFHAPYKYFDVVCYALKMLFNEMDASVKHDSSTLNGVLLGYKLLLEIIKVDWRYAVHYKEIRELVVTTNSYVISAILRATYKNFELLKLCLEVMIIAFNNEPKIIIPQLNGLKFLSLIVPNDFTKEIFLDESVLKYFVLTDLFKEEFEKHRSSDLVILYVKFVNACMKSADCMDGVKMPALMYVIHKIIPNIDDETFVPRGYKQKLILEITELLCDFMTKLPESFSACEWVAYPNMMDLFLTNKMYTLTLFKFLDCTCSQMQLMVTSEIDWKTSPVADTILITKRTLRCICVLLTYARDNRKIDEYSFFIRKLFSSTENGFSILKMIAEYFDNYFDKDISIAACNILAAFASSMDDSLLHTMKMDYFQVQCLFLERLRDEYEDIIVQFAVIRLIRCCIDKQIGMTSAFFEEGNNENTAFHYITEFVNTVKKECGFMHPIQLEFYDLLHEIWIKNKRQIIERIIVQENFWATITLPLCKVDRVHIDLSLKIFEMLLMEICAHEVLTEDFVAALERILNPSNNFLKKWFSQIVTLAKVNNGDRKLVALITLAMKVMKNFLYAIQRKFKDTFPIFNEGVFEVECLQILVLCSENSNDIKLLTQCFEICSLFPVLLTVRTHVKDSTSVVLLKEMLQNISNNYPEMDENCKTMMLGLLMVYFQNYQKYLTFGQELSLYFLPSLLKFFKDDCKKFLASSRNEKIMTEKDFYSWLLIIRLINIFVEDGTLEPELLNAFLEVHYLQKLMDFLKDSLFYPTPLMVVETTALCFVNCAQSKLIKYFDLIDMEVIYPDILSQRKNSYREEKKILLVVFNSLLKVYGIFLKEPQNHSISVILKFIFNHHQMFVDVMEMVTLDADIWHLKLTVDVLHFLYESLIYRYQWTIGDRKSFTAITNSIKKVLNISIGVILRPRILVFTQYNPNSLKTTIQKDVPEANFIKTCNEFVNIIAWSCLYFTRCNPKVPNLLSFFKPQGYEVVIDYDFRIPPAVNEEPHRLTYGGLLCVLRFFCKTFSQVNFGDKDTGVKCNTSFSEDYDTTGPSTSKSKETLDIVNVLYRYGVPELMDLPTSWFLNLDLDNIKFAIEAIVSFLAGQAFFAVRDPSIERSVMSYIKRELVAELMYFYKMVDKIINSNYFLYEQGKEPEKRTELCILKFNKTANITDIDNAYLLIIVRWFKQVCGLVHISKFDEFLSNWHAKSTWISEHNMYIKNTSVNICDDE